MTKKKTKSPLQQHVAEVTTAVVDHLQEARKHLAAASRQTKELAHGAATTYPSVCFSLDRNCDISFGEVQRLFPSSHGDKENLSGSIRDALSFACQYKQEAATIEEEMSLVIVENMALKLALDAVRSAVSLVNEQK